MEVLSGPWANVALFLRQALAQTDGSADGLCTPWLWGLLLFLSVCLLLLRLIVYLGWKLRQVEAEISESQQDRGVIYRRMDRSATLRRRSVG